MERRASEITGEMTAVQNNPYSKKASKSRKMAALGARLDEVMRMRSVSIEIVLGQALLFEDERQPR